MRKGVGQGPLLPVILWKMSHSGITEGPLEGKNHGELRRNSVWKERSSFMKENTVN